MLKQRVITAVVLFVAVLWVLFAASAEVFSGLWALVFCLAAWEWARLAGLTAPAARIAYALLFGALLATVELGGWRDTLQAPLICAAALAWPGLALWLWLGPTPAPAAAGARPLRLLCGFALLLPAWLAMLALHAGPAGDGGGGALLLYAMMLVWAADIGAYFAGRRFGRHKLAPAISPGKTWEGVAGGLLAVAALALFGLAWHGDALPAAVLLSASLCAGAISVPGDLLISWCKRSAGIKDTSQLLPGHGGLLDRIDSLLAALPVFAAGLLWFGGLPWSGGV